jgi:hypothetical protein
MKGDATGHHIWSSFTSDFVTFTKPSVWFNPGYVTIDATIFHPKPQTSPSQYYLVFKDQTNDPLRYQVRYASGPTVEGPWSHLAAPITPSWSEGPSVIQIGRTFVVFYDHYRYPQRFGAVETTDWIHWKDATSKIDLPPYCKHGSFIIISDEEAARLEARHDPQAAANAK